MESSNLTKLKEVVIENSVSNKWIDAKEEWKLYTTYKDIDGDNCACGHHINNVCVIVNTRNGIKINVGLVCVKKFYSKSIGDLSHVKFDYVSTRQIETAMANCWISAWEYNFYNDIRSRTKLSKKQMEIKDKIVKKILHRK